MSELDRNAILKQMGITQWILRDANSAQSPAQSEPEQQASIQQRQAVPDKQVAQLTPSNGRQEATRVDQPVASVAADPPSQDIESIAFSLGTLRNQVTDCEACALAQSRTQTVFGEGPDRADWLFVGEAPGQQEDRQGQPFVGRAGGLLTQMIRALNKSREQVYITNTLKCRPPNNRDPMPDELHACESYLLKQIELVQPGVMVALGRVSAQALLKSDQPLGKLRGQVYQYGPNKIPLIVTYHPAYLLRQPADKGKVWADLLLANRQLAV